MTTTANPLLKRNDSHRLKAIPFPEIKTEHYLPAIQEAIRIAKEEIEALKNNPAEPNFENTVLALELSGEQLDYVSSIYYNLLSAESDAVFKALAQQISPLLADFGSSIYTDPVIF